MVEKREAVESLELFPAAGGARCYLVTRFPIFDSHGEVALIGALDIVFGLVILADFSARMSLQGDSKDPVYDGGRSRND